MRLSISYALQNKFQHTNKIDVPIGPDTLILNYCNLNESTNYNSSANQTNGYWESYTYNHCYNDPSDPNANIICSERLGYRYVSGEQTPNTNGNTVTWIDGGGGSGGGSNTCIQNCISSIEQLLVQFDEYQEFKIPKNSNILATPTVRFNEVTQSGHVDYVIAEHAFNFWRIMGKGFFSYTKFKFPARIKVNQWKHASSHYEGTNFSIKSQWQESSNHYKVLNDNSLLATLQAQVSGTITHKLEIGTSRSIPGCPDCKIPFDLEVTKNIPGQTHQWQIEYFTQGQISN